MECSAVLEESDGEEDKKFNFSVSKEKSNWLNENELIAEDSEQITIGKYNHLLSDKVHLVIQEVLHDPGVKFKLQDFQLLTLHCLGNYQNVVLMS